MQSFDEVRQLGDADLRELLEHGRPEQRVWAIWTLALRRVVDVGDLGRREEPDPGVRRNLAVVLAGHGELELLVALARRDPAPEVRAAAIALAARLALDNKLPPAIVLERAAADSAPVRIAILGVVFAGAPRWLTDLAGDMLEDRDADVRYEAFEALIRAGLIDPALAWLEEAPEAEARIVLMRWTARTPGERPADRVHACAEVLAHASRRLRRLLIESVRIASWRELAPAVRDEPTLIAAFARREAGAVDQIPTATLLRAELDEHHDTWLWVLHRRLAALEAPDDDLAPLLPHYLDLCERRLANLDARLADIRARGGLEPHELEELETHRDTLATAIDHAARLMVH